MGSMSRLATVVWVGVVVFVVLELYFVWRQAT